MKKYFIFLQAVLLSIAFVACSDKDEPANVEMEIELSAGSATQNSLTFTVQTKNAERCSWVCVAPDGEIPTLENILETGTSVDVQQKATVEVPGLVADTEYTILAAVANGNAKKLSEKLVMRTLKPEEKPQPEILEANILLEATYRSDNQAGAGQYGLVISNAEPTANGEPSAIGDFQLIFNLINVADADPMNAVLPAGEYVVGKDFAPFTWNPTEGLCLSRIAEGAEGLDAQPMVDGIVTVKNENNQYVIDLKVTLFSGKEMTVRYTGDISFIQTGTADDRFTRDQFVKFEGTEKNFYYGNWFRAHADDLNLHFFTGKMDEHGKQTEGYYLSIPAFMEKVADPMSPDIRLQEGVYTISDRNLTQLTSIPMVLQKGESVDFMGDMLTIGTFMTYIDGKNGKKQLGLCVKGTMTVKHVGAGYKIDFDFETPEGIALKGVYEGELPLTNKCDNDKTQPKKPWSTLTEDRVFNIPQDAVAEAYLMGDYLYPGLNSWFLTIVPKEGGTNGDMFTTEFFTEGETFDAATYNIVHKFEAHCALPGWLDNSGNVLYSWFGDMTSVDAEGYAAVLAPIESGSFVVTEENGNKKFVFNLVDDANHKITGEWTGAVKVIDARENAAMASKVKRMMKAGFRR